MSTDSPGTPPDAPPPPLPPPPPSDSDNQKRADDFGDRGRSLESTPDFIYALLQKGLDDFSERKAAQPEASKPAPVSPEPAAAVPADSGPVVNQPPDKGLVQDGPPDKGLVQDGPPDKGLVQDRQAERGSTQGPALSSNNERADALGSRTGEAADLNIPSNERTVREVTVPEVAEGMEAPDVSEQQAEQPFNGSDDEGTPGSGDEWDLDKNSRTLPDEFYGDVSGSSAEAEAESDAGVAETAEKGNNNGSDNERGDNGDGDNKGSGGDAEDKKEVSDSKEVSKALLRVLATLAFMAASLNIFPTPETDSYRNQDSNRNDAPIGPAKGRRPGGDQAAPDTVTTANPDVTTAVEKSRSQIPTDADSQMNPNNRLKELMEELVEQRRKQDEGNGPPDLDPLPGLRPR